MAKKKTKKRKLKKEKKLKVKKEKKPRGRPKKEKEKRPRGRPKKDKDKKRPGRPKKPLPPKEEKPKVIKEKKPRGRPPASYTRRCPICNELIAGSEERKNTNRTDITACSEKCSTALMKMKLQNYAQEVEHMKTIERNVVMYGDQYFRFPKCQECDLRFKNIEDHVKQEHKYKDIKEYRKKYNLTAEDTKIVKPSNDGYREDSDLF